MGRKPVPKGWDLRKLPRCPSCGGRIRSPRDQKECPRCKVVKPITEFGHHRSRSDHAESYCASCKRAMQSSKARPFGELLPFGSVARVQGSWLTGTYAEQSPLVDRGVIPSRAEPVTFSYLTEVGRRRVYGMLLLDVITDAGERYATLRVPHAYAFLLKEPCLHPGARVVAVIENGEPMKVLVIDDAGRSITTVVDETLYPERPPRDKDGAWQLRSWNAARPWMLGCALRYLGIEPPEDERTPADVLLMDAGVPAEDVYPTLDALEDSYLLANLEPPVRLETEGGERWEQHVPATGT